jgi:hypothetical protein
MKRRITEVQLHIRLYPDQDDDLIRWLAQFDGQPYGAKTQAIKEALRRGVGAAEPPAPSTPPLDLSQLRQVVEAAVAQVLARFEVQVSGTTVAFPPGEDEETEDLLDSLQAALVVADEE